MLTSKPLTNNTIKIAVDDDKSKGDVYGGGLSDRDDVNGIEALAACVSPIKHRAWATNSVSNLELNTDYYKLKGLVGVKMEYTTQAVDLHHQSSSQATLQPALGHQHNTTSCLRAWTIKNLLT